MARPGGSGGVRNLGETRRPGTGPGRAGGGQAGRRLCGDERRSLGLPAAARAARPRAGPVDSPIDAFLGAELEKKGLPAAPPADRRTLLRRAPFDLTGLPPAPGEVEAFLADRSPDAFAKVVDRLLASPRYGE
jgi:hypothetical protein